MNSSSREKVPFFLRAWASHISSKAPIRQGALEFYGWSAEHVARSLRKQFGVRTVALTGGSVERCVPGVSDLDFILGMEAFAPRDEAEVLSELSVWYRAKKRWLPHLGEFSIVVSPKETENFLPGKPERLYFHKDRTERADVAKSLSSTQRFQLAIEHAMWALRYEREATNNPRSGFLKASFRREMSKSIAYARGEGCRLLAGTSFDLWRELRLGLEIPAEALLSEPWEATEVMIPEGKGTPSDLESLSFWFSRKMDTAPTAIPFVYEVDLASFDEGALFCDKLPVPPLFVGPHSARALELGWGMNDVIRWLSSRGNNARTPKNLGANVLAHLRGKIELYCDLFAGRVVTADDKRLNQFVSRLTRDAMAVCARALFSDLSNLAPLVRDRLPLTLEVSERAQQGQFSSRRGINRLLPLLKSREEIRKGAVCPK